MIIAVSIPLSILVSICCLSAIHQTINIMTLGGLALAVGILVDDATVEIENVNRNLEEGQELRQAILDGAQQIAVPALVSTLCICIVFLPMFFLSGVAKFLFVPLAEAVVFAMLASYLLSRTLVPTLAHVSAQAARSRAAPHAQSLHAAAARCLSAASSGCASPIELLLTTFVYRRFIFVPAVPRLCVCAASLLFPWLGQDFFPTSDNGQFRLHLRAKTGTRIEETARLNDLVDQSIRREIPASELDSIVDNMGLPYSGINTTYNTSGVIGSADADILVSLKEGHHRPTQEWVDALRPKLTSRVSRRHVLFPARRHDHADSQLRPSRAHRRADGRRRFTKANRKFADQLLSQIRQVPGSRRSAHPAAFRSAQAAHHRGPHQSRSRPVSLSSISPAACWCRSAAVSRPRPRST